MSAKLSSFLLVAASAAEPAQADVALRYEAATVSVKVTFQVTRRPSFYGVSVRQSGRLPSALKRPCGSLIDGNPALQNERQIRSFTKWWRCDRPGFRLHESTWEPRVSTEAPQMHQYGWQSSEPSRRPTATLKASLFRRSPHVDIGTAWSQSPLCAAAAARSLARWYWVVWFSSRVWNACWTTMESKTLWLPVGKESSHGTPVSITKASTLCWCLRQLPGYSERFVTGGEVCQKQKLKSRWCKHGHTSNPQTAWPTGRLAWVHLSFVNAMLQVFLRARRNWSSNCVRRAWRGCSRHGETLRIYCSFWTS